MADKDKDKKGPREQVNLLAAPDGWDYEVTLVAKDGRTIAVEPQDSGYEVKADLGDGEESTSVDSLKDGVKAAVAAARHLNHVENQRKALEAEQGKGLFGGSKPAPEPDPVAVEEAPKTSLPASDEDEQPSLV